MQMLKISTDLYVPANLVKYIVDYNGRQAKKVVAEKKKNNLCYDATHGKGTKSYVMLMDNTVMLSPYEAKTLCGRMIGKQSE